MRLPKLLIIGAMKAGTTGVFMDLCRHPQVFLPDNKEPHALRSDDVLTDAGRQAYAELYAGAAAGQLLCDASTGYTKRPDNEGVVDRALEVLPAGFRVVYVVREPIARMVSHHYHEFIEGKVETDINQVVRRESRYLDYTRYGYQLQPWLEALGPERVRVVRFEDYTADRQQTIEQLCRFIDLPVEELPQLESAIHNRNDGKPVMNPFWRQVQRSLLYQYGVRPLVSLRLRAVLQKLLLPRGAARPAPPDKATQQWIRQQLADEVRQISAYAGAEGPLWEGYETTFLL